jgi:hypothetical protein
VLTSRYVDFVGCFCLLENAFALFTFLASCVVSYLSVSFFRRQGDKLLGAAGRNSDILFIDKKEVQQLLKIVKAQTFS